GAILCFLAVAILSSHIVGPLAEVIGVPLGWMIALAGWVGALVFSVTGVGRFYNRVWYVWGRTLAFLLAFVVFLIPVGIVAGILALALPIAGIAAGLIGLGLAIAAAVVAWLRTPTEWPPEAQLTMVPAEHRGTGWKVVSVVATLVGVIIGTVVIGITVSVLVGLVAAPTGAAASAQKAVLGITVVMGVLAGIVAAVQAARTPRRAWPPAGPSRVPSRMARENTMRNPGRTAVTSSSLMIGVALVVFVAVFVNGFKNSFIGALDRSVTSDLIITSKSFAPIPKDAVSTTQAVQGVSEASGIQSTEAKINHGGTDIVNGIDPATFGHLYTFDWLQGGSDAILQHFTGNEALVEEQFAKSHHLNIGSAFEITSVQSTHLKLRVAGEYKDPTLMTGICIPTPTFDQFTVDNDPGVILVRFQPGVPTSQGKAAVATALKDFPVAKVQTNAEYKSSAEKQVNNILNLLYALLAMIGIISLVGIINTLALSVFERTREIGMLRAVGTTRRQLRRMVRYESVITSVIGGLLGVGVGLVFGWILTKGLSDQGISFSVPGRFVATVLIVAAFAGVVAAILPARRAASLDVLEALQYE
ncbi:MAG TPA: FtsX-like permease family protein, partial [Gemmatimonadales bacterium]|nr:FtsX-like permease family protein [Gemmatimonadales bacterium]